MTHRVIKRYLVSFYWYSVLFLRNRFIGKVSYFSKLGAIRCTEVHISCPGPSAKLIEAYKFPTDTPVIFVNHAVSLVESRSFSNTRNFFFSADGVRVDSIINSKLASLNKCTSIFVPGHLFQVTSKIIKSIDYIPTPKCRLSMKYGLIIEDFNIDEIQPLSDRTICYGFGSLLMAISFALIFKPKVIHLWGSDLKEVNGLTYFSKDIPKLDQLPFDLIKSSILTATKVLEIKGVKVMMHTSNEND